MVHIRSVLIACMLAVGGLSLAGQQTSSAATLFQQGLLLERAEGNLLQAIVLYERVIAEFPNDKTVVPQTLLHLARAYDKRSDPRAERLWARLAGEYPNSPYAAEAKRKVAEGQAQAAGPFRMRVIDGLFSDFTDIHEIAPDGRTIAYIREAASDDIVLRDMDTRKDRVLLQLPGRRVQYLRWSPDSKRIVFKTRDAALRAAGPYPHDVRIVTVQNAQTRTIAPGEFVQSPVQWSPDGRWLALSVTGKVPAANGDIRLVDAVTGETKTLAGLKPLQGGFAWSVDSKQVAFQTETPDQGRELRIASVDTGQTRPLNLQLDKASGPVNIATGVTATWTTDGRILVRQVPPGARGVSPGPGGPISFYFVNPQDGRVTLNCAQKPPLRCLLAMTPDGRFRLARDDGSVRLMILDTTTGTSRRVTAGTADESNPFLSPDGRLVIFVSNPDGERAAYVAPVDRTPVSSPVRLAPLSANASINSVAWSPDGRVILDLFSDEYDIYRINMDRNGRPVGAPIRLTQDTKENYSAAVSPDGNFIAYHYASGLAVMTSDGASERPLIQTTTAGHLEWRSADEVLFQRGGVPTSPVSIESVNVKTGVIQAFADLPPVGSRWQYVRSRNEIVYVPQAQNGNWTIRAKSLSGGNDRAIASVDGVLSGSISFRVSPDGQHIAYGRFAGSGADRRHEIRVMTIDGKNDRQVRSASEVDERWRGGEPYDWSPDSRFLIYDGFPRRGTVGLMVADVKTGEAWPIQDAVDSDQVNWWGGQWAPNGAFIVITRNGWRNEYRLVEGLTYDAVVKLMGSKK